MPPQTHRAISDALVLPPQNPARNRRREFETRDCSGISDSNKPAAPIVFQNSRGTNLSFSHWS
jgi:hypothetical protein